MENDKLKIFQSVLCFVVCLIKSFFFRSVAEKIIKKIIAQVAISKVMKKSFAIDTCLFMPSIESMSFRSVVAPLL